VNLALSKDQIISSEKNQGIRTQGRIPTDLELYQDHFPAFPVLPGVLGLEILKQSIQLYYRAHAPNKYSHISIRNLHNVKFTQFLKPGDEWQAELKLLEESDEQSIWQATMSSGQKTTISAQLCVALESQDTFHQAAIRKEE